MAGGALCYSIHGKPILGFSLKTISVHQYIVKTTPMGMTESVVGLEGQKSSKLVRSIEGEWDEFEVWILVCGIV